jgi:sarcosine oxidase subunit alpha
VQPGGTLACETPASGDRNRGTSIDLLRPLGRLGERMEPWFYETRFLRPRLVRQPALEVLRRLSAAPRLPSTAATVAGTPRERAVDVLVIGGGPSGVAAASVVASRSGTLAVVTRRRLGGSLPLEPEVAARVAGDVQAVRSSDATVLEDAMCLGWYGDEGFACMVPDGPVMILAPRVVVATGAYDRSLLLPGVDLPGVVGLRAFQLLAAQGAMRGAGIGVIGTGEELRRAVATASRFGSTVRWVAGAGPLAEERDGIPIHHGAVAGITGRGRARGVALDDGTELAADVVVLATTQPTYELPLQLGASATVSGTPPVILPTGPTAIPVLSVGEAAGWLDPRGTPDRSARATERWLAGDPPPETDPLPDGPVISSPSEHAVVCVCEDVRQRDVDRAIDEGFDDVELVKRRSGATTGACQGKLCMPLLAESFAARGLPPSITTVRPPLRPVPIALIGGRLP